jgi:hypothetical protein
MGLPQIGKIYDYPGIRDIDVQLELANLLKEDGWSLGKAKDTYYIYNNHDNNQQGLLGELKFNQGISYIDPYLEKFFSTVDLEALAISTQ